MPYIKSDLAQVYGDSVLLFATVKGWIQLFKSGKIDIKDEGLLPSNIQK